MKLLITDASVLKKIIVSGIAGTTTMTLYSYLISGKKGKRFREPQLLNSLLYGQEDKMLGPVEESRQPIPGFIAHYKTGILFAGIYHLIWKKKVKANVVLSGFGCGLILSILGISIWNTVFKVHPHPPKIDLKRFTGQLIIAHIIFGTTVALTSEALKEQNL